VLQISIHVSHYNEPELQRHVVRIILMVPIYALVSWFSLRWNRCRRWLSPARECYEAVVLYSFYCYLITSLQKKSGDYHAWIAALPPQHPIWPLNGTFGRFFGVHTIHNGPDFMHAMRQARPPSLASCSRSNILWSAEATERTYAYVLYCQCIHAGILFA
jgi:hypothetical protein